MKRPEQELIDASASSVVEYIQHLEANKLTDKRKQEIAVIAATFMSNGLDNHFDQVAAKERAALQDMQQRLGEDDDAVLQYQAVVDAISQVTSDVMAFFSGFITGEVGVFPDNDPETAVLLLREAIQRCEEATGNLVRFNDTPVTGALLDKSPDGNHTKLVEE